MFDSDELRKLATDKRYSTVQVGSLELLSLLDEYERLRVENERLVRELKHLRHRDCNGHQ